MNSQTSEFSGSEFSRHPNITTHYSRANRSNHYSVSKNLKNSIKNEKVDLGFYSQVVTGPLAVN